MKLTESFYERTNVVKIARELLGKGLFTNINGIVTGGKIVETEAYSWKEKGCHAFAGKKTSRNEVMFGNGGHAYVYLCYGMHHLFNVVTNKKGVAEAVLIRAIEPLVGLPVMLDRRGKVQRNIHLTSGPGKLTKALGIDRTFNGKYLLNRDVWIEDLGEKIASRSIVAGKRIGIDYAGDDALLPWRFMVKESKWISK
ncbi:MAG: DNA-3-methyladenine glycosylase [Cyclobacteriaceae bacterium]